MSRIVSFVKSCDVIRVKPLINSYIGVSYGAVARYCALIALKLVATAQKTCFLSV